MTSFARGVVHTTTKWAMLFVALTLTTTVLLQALNFRPVFAADDGGYPWAGATEVNLSDYDWGYQSPCPSDDTNCFNLSEYLGTTNYGLADPWVYYLRNCTSYAAWKIKQVYNIDIPSTWGNASSWDSNATGTGHPYTNDSSPQVGDIAQWGTEIAQGLGHVAYVWKVSGTTAYFEDYNSGNPLNTNNHPATPQWGLFYSGDTSASNAEGQAPDHYIHIGTVPNSSVPTPNGISFNGDLNVFKVAGDNNLYQTYWNGSTWSGFTSIGTGFVSNPATIVNGSALNVFVRNGNGQIYTEYNSGSGWSGWSSLGTHQMKGNPIVMFYGTSMNVFALDTNNVPYEDTWTSASGWTGWNSNTNYMGSDPGAVSYGGNLYLIYRGGDNKVYDDVFGSSGWSGWGEIPGYGVVKGNPSVLNYSAEGELDVYFNTSVNHIYKTTYNGTSWGSSWTDMGSSFNGDPYISTYGNDLQVYARDTSNNIETRYWSYSGQNWSSWSSLGGSSYSLASDPFALQYGSENDVLGNDVSGNAYKDAFNSGWGGFSALN